MRSALICGNETTIRTSIKNKLKELAFDTIFECCDGESAASIACESLPDIAILDAAMLHQGGLNAACEIRQKLKIPVILLISLYDPDTLRLAKEIGITTILTKPFRGQDLLPAVELAFAHVKEVEFFKDQVKSLNKTIESQAIIHKAKDVLLRTKGFSESEAFRKIQKLAMDQQKSMRQIAEAILSSDSV